MDSSQPDGAPQASILLVDDHPANMLALEAALAPLGHRLVGASSGEEALRRVLQNDFALIILDVQMPELDGFQTASLIKTREKSRHIPIIFLTAKNKELAHVEKGYAHGAVDYLVKPFEPEILRSKTSVFVELWQRGVQLERKEAALRQLERERLARESEQRHRALLEAIPQAVLAMLSDGSLYYANQAWRQYSGAAPSLWAALHDEDVARVLDEWAEARATRRPLELEARLLRAHDRRARWHLLHLRPLHLAAGREGWIAVATDIHDGKTAREQAETASRAKDEFLATLSHELRNPLNAILGWTRMLRGDKLDDERVPRALQTIERNAEMQAALIEDMLDVSRIITGKLRLSVGAVELSRVVQAALDTVRLAADAKEIALSLVLDDVPPTAGDRDRLQQVVWNLLSNAIKFTPRGGHVTVALKHAGDHAEIVVSDDGPGIAPEFLPYVFDRFRQADSSSTRMHGGLGLGLAIVRHLCELHGGTVAVTSEPGRGATFTVTLPLRALVEERPPFGGEAAARGRPERARAPGDALAGVRVLVVDDEPDACELLVAILEHHGAIAVSALSAEEALERLRALRPDVLVSDIGMPVTDGYELVARLRALGPANGSAAADAALARTPAVALTGFARASDGERALSCGFDAHVAKPVDAAALVSIVGELARRPRDVTPPRDVAAASA